MDSPGSYSLRSIEGEIKRKVYFPRVPSLSDALNLHLSGLVSQRPEKIDPIFDKEHVNVPLESFDELTFARIYRGSDPSGVAKVPPIPDEFACTYVYPYLTRNEYQRLTTVWYFTQSIEEDKQFLFTLNHLLRTFQKAVGWEFAIAGILDEATYTRLAAVNLPVAVLPRRESTCSHTVNQEMGSVFMVTDMKQDWRFRLSPHVEVGGLTSYAGTQLKVSAGNGDMVALGSLCVASSTKQDPLGAEDLSKLVAIADVIVDQMRNRVIQIRMRERQRMLDVILTLKECKFSSLESKMLELSQRMYTGAKVTLQDMKDDQLITLTNRPSVSLSEYQDNIWEDTDYVLGLIATANFGRLHAEQSVRAITVQCGNFSKCLVVDSAEIRHVFDDFDCWFIERCASIYAEKLQTRLLQKSLEVNKNLLRSITHQLRTPVHGILGSVDLLAEDLASRDLLVDSQALVPQSQTASPLTAYLSAIQSSGSELMTTINDIIKVNALFASLDTSVVKSETYDIKNLEADILTKALEAEGIAHLDGLSIQVVGLSEHLHVKVDSQRLQDCVVYLLLNAIQATLTVGGGIVKVAIATQRNDSTLQVDITNAGPGISIQDQEKIFEASERIGSPSPGASVELALARRYAEHLGGSLILLASETERGTTFRAEFPLSTVVSPEGAVSLLRLAELSHVPRSYQRLECLAQNNHMLEHITQHLEQRGFREAEQSQTPTLIIADQGPSSHRFLSHLEHTSVPVVVIFYMPYWAGKTTRHVSERFASIVLSGPLYTTKLDAMLIRVDLLYAKLINGSRTNCQSHSPDFECTTPEDLVGSPSPVDHVVNGPTPSKPPRLASAAGNRIGTALLVDDNNINLRILRIFCEKRSIPFRSASDGNEAVDHYSRHMITSLGDSLPLSHNDESVSIKTGTEVISEHSLKAVGLILMDLQMPNCTGIEATIAIRTMEQEHSLKPAVIFMITGQDSEQDRNNSLTAGVDEFLVKPVRMSVLDRLIEKHFGLNAA